MLILVCRRFPRKNVESCCANYFIPVPTHSSKVLWISETSHTVALSIPLQHHNKESMANLSAVMAPVSCGRGEIDRTINTDVGLMVYVSRGGT